MRFRSVRVYTLALLLTFVIAAPASWLAASPARAEGPNAIVAVPSATSTDACRDTILARNDDGSAPAYPLPFTLNFFGANFTQVFVNNNGNLTFLSPLSTYTPFPLLTTGTPIVAPFFGDVDTRATGSGVVTYSGRSFGLGTFAGRPTFCADWVDVGYFSFGTNRLNSFQALLVDRSDVGVGDFDIYFNYDKVQWEAGSASGGNGGLGGSSARAGYSNGGVGGVTGASFELPGSAMNGAFLDTNTETGLTWNSLNSTQLGRYYFPVRNGAAPVGGTLTGTVRGGTSASSTILPGAFVQACSTSRCSFSQTNSAGQYTISGLPADTYNVRASPPSGTNFQTEIVALSLSGSGTTTQDFLLPGPQPLPNGTTITNRYVNPNGTPVIYWQDALTLTTTGCAGGSASYELVLQGAATPLRGGTMTEGPAGTYTATVAAVYPSHGNATVTITIVCGGVPSTFSFDIYIDPSGTVRTTTGTPIAGATVSLRRADTSAGPFTIVPNGSAFMSAVNRNNPDTTDAAGHFGWDVVAGFYVVRASATDCTSPSNPSQAFVESAVLTIPPAVLDLDLRLACANRDTTAPVTTATPSPPANANGWNDSDVTVNLAATDEAGGSGVRDITYSLSGAQTAPPVTFPGATASTTITSDGATIITYFASDNAGNLETPHGLIVRIDRTAPAVIGSRLTPANANGWNNTAVAVHFEATDALSGIDGANTFDTTVGTAGAGQSVSHTFLDRAGNSGSTSVGGINLDFTSPTTTATALPPANANGWRRTGVDVALSASDDLSGVAATEYNLDAAGWTAYTTPITVSGDGIHTLAYRSTDRADNQEAAQSLSVQIDGTAPVVVTSRTAPNANGWNNTAVAVHFQATDALSGIDGAATFDTTISGEGASQSVSHTFLDRAGNPGSATVGAINIDFTSPTTSATPSPAPNAAGWWRSSVNVTLSAADNLSGVALTEFRLDSGPWTPYTAAIAITAQGTHALRYRSTDRAGNHETEHTLTVRIDLTSPEASLRFDPATQDLAVFGRDSLSGVVSPISATVSASPVEGNAFLRIYNIGDVAGNTLDLAVVVKREGKEIKASVRSLRYNGGAVITPAENRLSFEWSLTPAGALKELEQDLEVGDGPAEQDVQAKFRADRNPPTTTIKLEHPERSIERSGLILLRLATAGGTLVIEFD